MQLWQKRNVYDKQQTSEIEKDKIEESTEETKEETKEKVQNNISSEEFQFKDLNTET